MTLLSVNQISHHFGDSRVLDDISLTLGDDVQCCAILGDSGCGKTTLLRLISGLENVQKGTITLRGNEVASDVVHITPMERKVGMVFQHPSLFPHMNVYDNVAFGVSKDLKNEHIEELLELIGLSDKADAYPHQLSGGQQHRVALARSVASDVSLLLLDEVFSHLNMSVRQQVRDDTFALLKTLNVPVVMVTHDAEEALAVADYLVVMDGSGSVVQQGDPKDIYNHPIHSNVMRVFGEVNVLCTDQYESLIEGLTKTQGKKPVCAIRAQHVTVGDEGVEAKISDICFMGEYQRLVIDVQGASFISHVDAGAKCNVGDSVTLSVDEQYVHWLDN